MQLSKVVRQLYRNWNGIITYVSPIWKRHRTLFVVCCHFCWNIGFYIRRDLWDNNTNDKWQWDLRRELWTKSQGRRELSFSINNPFKRFTIFRTRQNGIDTRSFIHPSCDKIKIMTDTQSKQQGESPGI